MSRRSQRGTECVGDGVLDVPLRAVPVLLCRGGRLRPPWMTAGPVGRDPCVPPSLRRAALSFRASDRVTGAGIRLFGLGRTDCRVASLLAMTECVGDGVPDVPFCAVPVLPCRGGRLRPPWMTAAPCRAGPMCPAVPSAPRCHSAPVTVSPVRESVSSRAGGAFAPPTNGTPPHKQKPGAYAPGSACR